ncbi:MAG: DUF1275 domain-containing protein [Myxococcaceae bacterium]|nr:DUF1275 domain-containing protein [Myxococcaceae bacterium]
MNGAGPAFKNNAYFMKALHAPESVYSLRHVHSWLMLCFAAGAVNVGALLACQRFVTHVTGSATEIGVNTANGWLALDYTVVVLCFILGALAASMMIDGRAGRGLSPWYTAPLAIELSLLTGIAVTGHLGLFGAFGGSIETLHDFVLLSVLGFAMGLQNAAVATSTGLVVRTTHLTGTATDLGINIARAMSARDTADRALARRAAWLRAGKLVAFVAGAGVMSPVAREWGYLSFLLPAVLVFIATATSFTSVALEQATAK